MLNSDKQSIAIIGAGPGGLTAGLLLAHQGFDVHIYEKEGQVGGRNGDIQIDGFRFDIGPTFLLMKHLLDQVFEEVGMKSEDYLEFTRLDPMYRLSWEQKQIDITDDHSKMKENIAKLFPGEEAGFDKYFAREKKRAEALFPCLERHYSSIGQLFNSPKLLKAIPHLTLRRSVFDVLGDYFEDDDLKLAFTFQAKYLGMSPWSCPGFFTMLGYMEHAYGIYHVKGGLSEISQGMAKAFKKLGGTIHLNTKIEEVEMKKGTTKSITLDSGEKIRCQHLIINADFAHAMDTIMAGKNKKYTKGKIRSMKYSCSTYMLYLGLDTIYPDEPHHHIIFSKDYRANIEGISKKDPSLKNFSVYVRNASINDPTLAPKGGSAIYVLVPVSHMGSGVDWDSVSESFRDDVLSAIEQRTNMKDIRDHIVCEKSISPADWERSGVYLGATFNLAHTLDQMTYFRPKNRLEHTKNVYLVGGGTHPGSGLPTIYESGRIVAGMIQKKA